MDLKELEDIGNNFRAMSKEERLEMLKASRFGWLIPEKKKLTPRQKERKTVHWLCFLVICIWCLLVLYGLGVLQ